MIETRNLVRFLIDKIWLQSLNRALPTVGGMIHKPGIFLFGLVYKLDARIQSPMYIGRYPPPGIPVWPCPREGYQPHNDCQFISPKYKKHDD